MVHSPCWPYSVIEGLGRSALLELLERFSMRIRLAATRAGCWLDCTHSEVGYHKSTGLEIAPVLVVGKWEHSR